MTRAQLATLYSAGGTSTLGGDTVYPCLTITGSSPRSNLETAIGVSDTTAEAAAKAAGCDQIQQNSGNAFYTFAKGIPSGADAIIPISSGDWIGQANGWPSMSPIRPGRRRRPSHRSPTARPASVPDPGTAPNLTPNTTYYQDTNFGYNLYTVLPTNTLSGLGEDANLVSLFTNTAGSGNNARSADGHPVRDPQLRLRQPDRQRRQLRVHHHPRRHLSRPRTPTADRTERRERKP